MFIAGFPAGAWGTNCYLVAPGPGEECVIVDPGHQAAAGVEELVREHRLKPVAVLLTHGHIDHVASVVPVCGAKGVPAWIHPEDRYMMSDPERALGRSLGTQLMGELTVGEPDDVRELTDGSVLELAGLSLTVDHAPGHTGGSVTFRTPGAEDLPPVLFSGDLLFAGSIGRTDLPGGDGEAIMRSLARVCLPLDDATVVLSGHGGQTTIGRERATNPYLRQAAGADGAPAFPRRGM
ncbi:MULTISPECIES: MBL fold metallo-hydrolase [Streptomycetaceae]|uniref:MBL fold metallo-hydrolase n=1 Tax=Kitasatospora purpeofusca TaxID=67352 RepID=A0ABZ1U7D4_9ACTN|nr:MULTISPECIES: MBL fold metallo-hydrolase [Streptomycetaceae]KJY38935.1 hydrolase [Streptomyces sp. NRRL S-495]MCX4684527.1 MBL fold metallo-hydrolase [Kitasatospora purpeofusca]WTA54871.1 MBL fold metallo-hydrolase [Kitasatospora purpeofusca]BEK64758.1 MBL fold metallo-hydrolase [Kitasatospora purpeofusca]